MSITKSLVIIGAGELAELVRDYFERDTNYRVAGFAVNREYLKEETFLGLPVVAFEECEKHFPPDSHDAYVAVVSSHLNRDRARLFLQARQKGYTCATYVSPRAFVGTHVTLGENVFIFEDNVIQYGCRVEDNVILWSGNHIGHRTVISSHVFVSSHVVISGFCTIGEYCFLGVNAAIGNHVKIGQNCTVGAGATLVKDLPDNAIAHPATVQIRENASSRLWRVKID